MITVRLFAAARDAAGTSTVSVGNATSLGALVSELVRAHGRPMERVLLQSSILVDGRVLRPGRDDAEALREEGTVDVLPPFAGG